MGDVAAEGKHSIPYFWPGSDVQKGPWSCSPDICPAFNSSQPYADRIDYVTGRLRRTPKQDWPSFVTLYFEETDYVGHHKGTSVPQMTSAIEKIDAALGYLMQQLDASGALDAYHLIVVGDHGMADVCRDRTVVIDQLLPDWAEKWAPLVRVDAWGPMFMACVNTSHEQELYDALSEANSLVGPAKTGMDVYLRDQIPEPYHFHSGLSDRICPIVGVAREGWEIRGSSNQRANCRCGGNHGYRKDLQSMHSVFYGRGPRFEPGRRVPAFDNVELYNIMADIIGVVPAANNGSAGFASEVLLPAP
eukprot:CAMPEP_0177627848 /NCGR_PEP_ID=MMETSP0419_2-20121207/31429_1 /TAXON_ID=582737 /ORGANISM="Tetraselmis sp., Strain GSL018" /LENGTH=303 /DNA_ID=CAMNT_0019129043 /DNA_START=764 /DNA_END=1676 /DNA_ORIENTATION=+